MGQPFEITRWESAASPSSDLLQRMLSREGLTPDITELPEQTHTPEMRFDKPIVYVLISGHIQYSFPGYGVIELEPGDMLEIHPGILHDVIVGTHQTAMLLQAFR